jgi:signal transduction histidine kinase
VILEQVLVALQQAYLDISARKEIRLLLQAIVERATRLLKATGGSIFLSENYGEGLQLVASHGLECDSTVAGLRRREEVAAQVASGWQSVRAEGQERSTDRSSAPADGSGWSILAVPILWSGRMLGVLSVSDNRPPRLFTKGDEGLLSLFASQAAFGLENARLHGGAKEAEQAKLEFIDFVAHELKQPMTSMQGYAKMLTMGIGGELTDTQQQFVGVINANVDRLGKLVNDLLEISRLEAGRITLELAPVALGEVVDETLTSMRSEIEARHHTLILEVADDLPLVMGDRERLVQILTNLVSNAYRYTPDGGIIQIIASGPQHAEAPPEHLIVSVSDTGIGMSAQEVACLEEKFFRADDDLVRSQQGTGLGVPISRNLVKLHGGEFMVDSEAGRGSTFRFTVPIAAGGYG